MSLKLNGYEVPVTRFPDNTTQVWKIPAKALDQDYFEIDWVYGPNSGIVELAQLYDLLKASSKTTEIDLYITYLPFARQDKPIGNEETFALHSFARLLNTMDFNLVSIRDPHSHVAIALINNARGHYPIFRVKETFDKIGADLVCYPDVGALAKYNNLYKLPFVTATKEREASTGYIKNMKVLGNVEGKKVLIVDDICDGGMTFRILAEKLYLAGAKEVNLFVTHGLFTKGTRILRDTGIVEIFTPKGPVGSKQRRG